MPPKGDHKHRYIHEETRLCLEREKERERGVDGRNDDAIIGFIAISFVTEKKLKSAI